MKTVVYDILKDVFPEIPGEKILTAASVDQHYEPPFIILRGAGSNVGAVSGHGLLGVEIWFHDGYGSYNWIDDSILRLRTQMPILLPRVGQHNAVLASADWQSDSPDLVDDGYRTICRFSSWSLFGRDAYHPVG